MEAFAEKSAWFMMHRIRLALHEKETVGFGGDGKQVEVDETFVGGAARLMHADKRREKIKDATSLRTFVELMLERFSAASLAQKKTHILLFGGKMKTRFALLSFLLLILLSARVDSQGFDTTNSDSGIKVILLGTAAGPTFNARRLGISTLVLAGPEKLLFDCGRGMTTGMAALAINPADVTKVFLTHLHSDHIISLPELYLFPWSSGRNKPLQVWGPDGTGSMMKHLEEAFVFDIHIRRDVDEKFSPEGIKVIATDIRQGVVYEANGVKVTAFLVDHGPVKPAFGYRVDYHGHSVVISGDTKPSDNLVEFSQGVDLLIHEVAGSKADPLLVGPPDELLPGSRQTRGQRKTILDHHTDGLEAGQVFQRVKPKLAVFSHYNVEPAATLALVRQNYAGPVEFGEDLMTIEVGDTVSVHRFASANR